VVGVKNDRSSIKARQLMHMMACRDCARNGRPFVVVLETLSREKGAAAVGELDDNRGIDLDGGLERGIYGAAAGYVNGGEGERVRLSEGEDLLNLLARNDTRRYGKFVFGHFRFLQ
jgi:hypothetical protein